MRLVAILPLAPASREQLRESLTRVGFTNPPIVTTESGKKGWLLATQTTPEEINRLRQTYATTGLFNLVIENDTTTTPYTASFHTTSQPLLHKLTEFLSSREIKAPTPTSCQ
jgi:hypothetical protein